MFALVGVVGLVLLAFAGGFAWQVVDFYRAGVRVPGVVTSSFKRRLVRGHRDMVRVRYTLDGVERTGEGEVATSHAEGEAVTLLVRAQTPDEVLVVHCLGNWWRPVLLTAFGLLLCWLGFAQFFRG
jgi:hypothetical protein